MIGPYWWTDDISGILGLSQYSTDDGIELFMDKLFNSGAIKKKIFSISILDH